jgi:segregation and condensation protein B
MSDLAAVIQAILFTAGEPVGITELMLAGEASEEDTLAAIDELTRVSPVGGLIVQHHNRHWQLVTSPRVAGAVKRYHLSEARTELSRAALETLAMIAYRGPITRLDLDELRGVSSDAMLRNLVHRGLITEATKATNTQQVTRYEVTHQFLEHVGLASLADLPPLDEEPLT